MQAYCHGILPSLLPSYLSIGRVCDYAYTPLRGTLVDTLGWKHPNLGRARV